MIATIAAHQFRSLRRRRVLSAFGAIMIAVTVLAGVIGWSSHRTIARVYNEAVVLLGADGGAAPPNPFELKPTLSLLSNMAIYVPLIGALLALIVGNLSIADDQSSGIGRLIFSRQVSRSSYFLGKLLGTTAVVAVVLAASLFVSIVALLVANETAPDVGDLSRLVLFYAVSWLYLMVFVLIGMVTVLCTERRSLALLSAIGVWLVITFAVPQFTSGLRPTASLNPVTDPVSTTQTFFRITSHARPFSVSEQYKHASAQILDTASGSAANALVRILPIAGLAVSLALAAFWLVGRHDYSRSTSSG
ncbi:MAG: ABC transporter permease [Actinomycetota bacterium]|nr:ABC transporter permease [Actinomycetota bacterium]